MALPSDDDDPAGAARKRAYHATRLAESPPWYPPETGPRIPEEALARAVRTGRLWFQPDTSGDSLQSLLELDGLAESLTQLTLYASGSFDASGLHRFPNLQRLATNVRVSDGVSLPALVEYEGPLVPAVLHAPKLRRLSDGECSSSGTELDIQAPVERIVLTRSRSLARFPTLSVPHRLRSFELYRSKGFDLTGVKQCTGLEWLELASVRRLSGFEHLERLPSIVSLLLDNVAAVDPLEAAELLRPFRAHVSGRHSFPPDLRARLAASPSRWTFPPSEAYFHASPPV